MGRHEHQCTEAAGLLGGLVRKLTGIFSQRRAASPQGCGVLCSRQAPAIVPAPAGHFYPTQFNTRTLFEDRALTSSAAIGGETEGAPLVLRPQATHSDASGALGHAARPADPGAHQLVEMKAAIARRASVYAKAAAGNGRGMVIPVIVHAGNEHAPRASELLVSDGAAGNAGPSDKACEARVGGNADGSPRPRGNKRKTADDRDRRPRGLHGAGGTPWGIAVCVPAYRAISSDQWQ